MSCLKIESKEKKWAYPIMLPILSQVIPYYSLFQLIIINKSVFRIKNLE